MWMLAAFIVFTASVLFGSSQPDSTSIDTDEAKLNQETNNTPVTIPSKESFTSKLYQNPTTEAANDTSKNKHKSIHKHSIRKLKQFFKSRFHKKNKSKKQQVNQPLNNFSGSLVQHKQESCSPSNSLEVFSSNSEKEYNTPDSTLASKSSRTSSKRERLKEWFAKKSEPECYQTEFKVKLKPLNPASKSGPTIHNLSISGNHNKRSADCGKKVTFSSLVQDVKSKLVPLSENIPRVEPVIKSPVKSNYKSILKVKTNPNYDKEYFEDYDFLFRAWCELEDMKASLSPEARQTKRETTTLLRKKQLQRFYKQEGR
ncbi:uncharacterized protein SPAPADRAFT_52184 [Spathaspora passalidarum NRRL Y-27907]|uniref:Uncharacterized protein n=1 Tax=Spathaspora passalidarum (strain NRRL Y-27907 / 11-Y1) TaxID=619300 RepID=G3ATN5_SPAPN|nr:uncharacterized protein SPAPADRAFT_52184 [Spathaspora passalidarum NRRL Y-27907]EGW30998.1 hypothetical protein SPAPADRAFT_52184 [Spathaspora passalidarum NRRL Y-27907]